MAKLDLISLAKFSGSRLERIMRESPGPDPEILVGWEFKGHNVPWWTRYAGIYKFKKGFYKDADGYGGYNIPVRTSELTEPWECRPSNENPKRFGFYKVAPASECPDAGDAARYPSALLLDYPASPHNPILDPSRVLKDYVVQAEPGNDDLFLGKAYLALGPARVFLDYFILERDCQSNYKGPRA